jgi:hypothetical protein
MAPARTVAYAVAYTGPQRDSAAVCSVQLVRSEAETSIAASFKTTAFVNSDTPPRLILRTSRAGVPPVGQRSRRHYLIEDAGDEGGRAEQAASTRGAADKRDR